jgi:Domain of unknown function (DUF4279)
MPHLSRAVAMLRIVGPDLQPEEISAILGSQPSRSEVKGESVQSRHGLEPRVAKNGVWRLEAAPTEPEDFDLQVEQLLSGLTQDLRAWNELSERFKLDVFCGWFMKESNEGVDIKPSTLAALGSRGISLALDIYAPGSDA